MSKTVKILKAILESVWLIMALLALIIGIRESFSTGFLQNWLYFLFAGIAFFFFFTRRNQRLNS